jgi:hypothetical protein
MARDKSRAWCRPRTTGKRLAGCHRTQVATGFGMSYQLKLPLAFIGGGFDFIIEYCLLVQNGTGFLTNTKLYFTQVLLFLTVTRLITYGYA